MKYEEMSHTQRIAESGRLRERHPGSIPVIIQCKFLSKKRYLVPHTLTVAQFLYTLRGYLTVHASQSLFLFVGNDVLPPAMATVQLVSDEHLGDDGFLHMRLEKEKVFG